MPELSVRDAISEALFAEMERDETVFLQGIDVAGRGGAFSLYQGLEEEFGRDRVRNTPISEVGIVGSGIGAAMTGMRPVIDLMYAAFMGVPMDQILNQMAKLRYMTDGELSIPITIRAANVSGYNAAAQHSQALHSLMMGIPGLKVVCVSTPRDAKGLLQSAIRDDNPVIVFEHAGVYNRSESVPAETDVIPIGEASVEVEGDDVTVIATQRQLWHAFEAADRLADRGVSVEVVSPRTVSPLDVETLVSSVRKTGNCVVVDETPLRGGFQSEVAAEVSTSAHSALENPVSRLGVDNTPMPFSPSLEDEVVPGVSDIVDAVEAQLAE